MEDKKLFTSTEVANQLGLQRQSITYYHKKYGIGQKYGMSVMFTKEDIQEIIDTDGRRGSWEV